MEFRDLPDHKELLESRDLRGRKGLLVQWARPEPLVLLDRLAPPVQLALRESWDSPALKDFRDRRVNKGRKDLRDLQGRMECLAQIPTLPPQA
jgi:hypothetical protein